jgi:hypothetical protein
MALTQTALIQIKVSDNIATIAFDNYAKRNALSAVLITEMLAALSANPRGGSSASSRITGRRLSDALVAFSALAAARMACRAVRFQPISRSLRGLPPGVPVRGSWAIYGRASRPRRPLEFLPETVRLGDAQFYCVLDVPASRVPMSEAQAASSAQPPNTSITACAAASRAQPRPS